MTTAKNYRIRIEFASDVRTDDADFEELVSALLAQVEDSPAVMSGFELHVDEVN